MKLLISYPNDDGSSILKRLQRGFKQIKQSGIDKVRVYEFMVIVLNMEDSYKKTY